MSLQFLDLLHTSRPTPVLKDERRTLETRGIVKLQDVKEEQGRLTVVLDTWDAPRSF